MTLPIETGSDDLRAHPRHTGRHGLDVVLALAAIFISLVSLFVAVEHGRVEGKLLAASTWPFLQISRDGEDHGETVSLTNAGVGPAKLVSLRMFLDGHVVPDIAAFEKLCCGLSPSEGKPFFVSSNMDNSVLRPGQRDIIFRFTDPTADRTTDPGRLTAVARAANHLSWEACYCSVFDECWLSDLDTLRTRPVSSCPPVADSFNSRYFS